MKTMSFVTAAAICIVIARTDFHPLETRREKAIAEHRVTIAMTREEVERSLGHADTVVQLDETDVAWGWSRGRWVMFTGRALVDSGYFNARGEVTDDPAQQAAVGNLVTAFKKARAVRKTSILPGFERPP